MLECPTNATNGDDPWFISMRHYLYWYEAFWVKSKSKTMRVMPNEWTILYQRRVEVVHTEERIDSRSGLKVISTDCKILYKAHY